jgi:ABC-2 type transport system permease protein
MSLFDFSPRRFAAVAVKEFIQMRRDRMTLAMMIGVPVLQLTLFGYAINTNPKYLPSAVVSADKGPFVRTIVSAMERSDYFRTAGVSFESDAGKLLRSERAQFVVTFPEDFTRELVKGGRPAVLIEADAADPTAVSYALAAFQEIAASALDHDLRGPLSGLRQGKSPFEVRLHRLFNPEIRSQVNVVTGLLGVILTMTMIFITSLAVTREKERGTMENLLCMPVTPLEVMAGKIVPYILVGYVQVAIVLTLARTVFDISFAGSVPLLLVITFFFIAVNLALGVTISTLAANQLQAVQMSVFIFLPSILLSGFMFPFRGMPFWAQCVGNCLPLTHYMSIARGILLRGAALSDFAGHFAALMVILVIVVLTGLFRYRKTLD